MGAVYPITSKSRDLNIRYFKRFAFVENDAQDTVTVDLTTLFPKRKVCWYEVMEEPFERKIDSGRSVAIPAAGLLGVVFNED